jgi:hypothetical protein
MIYYIPHEVLRSLQYLFCQHLLEHKPEKLHKLAIRAEVHNHASQYSVITRNHNCRCGLSYILEYSHWCSK